MGHILKRFWTPSRIMYSKKGKFFRKYDNKSLGAVRPKISATTQSSPSNCSTRESDAG